MSESAHPTWLHRVALATACLLFPLIFVGAGVTSHGAGMAYPDWPTSAGRLVNPEGWWQSTDTRWEHGHRLIGWTVGMLAIATVALALATAPAAHVKRLAAALLCAIVLQGVLGGLRVTRISTSLAMVHGIWGQVCFTLAAVVVLVTSRLWHRADRAAPTPATTGLRRLALCVAGAVFLQVVTGAALRHAGTPVQHIGAGHALLAHIMWAIVVALIVGWIAMWAIAQHPDKPLVNLPARAIAVLLVVQLLLGPTSYFLTLGHVQVSDLTRWAVPTAHTAVGALMLAGSTVLAIGCHVSLRPVGVDPETAIQPS